MTYIHAGWKEGVGHTFLYSTRSVPCLGPLQPYIQDYKPWNRNPDLEVLFFPHLMLRFPPILAGV